jgi:hypothetical protein
VHWEKIPNEAFIGDIKNVGQKKMVTDIAIINDGNNNRKSRH